MKFHVTLFQDRNGMYIAECPSIPGYVSPGKTEPGYPLESGILLKTFLNTLER